MQPPSTYWEKKKNLMVEFAFHNRIEFRPHVSLSGQYAGIYYWWQQRTTLERLVQCSARANGPTAKRIDVGHPSEPGDERFWRGAS